MFQRVIVSIIMLCVFSQATTFETGFSPKMGSQELIVKEIGSAKKTIYVAAYSFTSKPIAHALCDAVRRGVKVYAVIDYKSNHDSTGTVKDSLTHVGSMVVLNNHYAILHHKFMVVDSCDLELGSFNYSANAYASNAENVMVIHKAPMTVIDAYMAQWNRMAKE